MAIIANISQALIDEHIAWHSLPGNAASGGRAINPWPPTGGGPARGSGEEFLTYHDGYVQRFNNWLNNLPVAEQPNPESIAPWTTVPTMLKMGMVGWNAQLANQEQQLSDMSNFSTLDELGRMLEWGLHGFLHQGASAMWNESVLLTFESPRSSYFWQLHGLIDRWRAQWVANQAAPVSVFAPLDVDAPATAAAIGTPGEVDRFEFMANTPGTYIIETSGPTDVVMYLAGPNNSQQLLETDDDDGQGLNARITRPLVAGAYFVYVVHFSNAGVGNYQVRASRG